MKRIFSTCGVLFLLWSSSYLPDNKKVFKKMYALEGIWKMKTHKGFICEEWKKVEKNYLQSRGYMIKGPDTIMNERVELTRTKENILYTSVVEDQNDKKPVVFTLTSSADNVFIFENPGHDFPKRIVYHLVTTDSLHAFIDDGIEGTKKVQHFYYTRFKN